MWSIEKSVQKEFSIIKITNVQLSAERSITGNISCDVYVSLTNVDSKFHAFGFEGMLTKNGNYLGEFSVHGWPFDGIKLMPGQSVTKKCDYCNIQDKSMPVRSGLLVKIGLSNDIDLSGIDAIFTKISVDK